MNAFELKLLNVQLISEMSITLITKMSFIQDVYCTNPQRTDIMYQKSCMEGYLLQFKENIETTVNFQEEEKVLIRSTCRLHSRMPFPIWIREHMVILYLIFET